MIEELRERGAAMSPADNIGSCPLHVAAYMGRSQCVRALLESGAAADARMQARGGPALTVNVR